MTSRLRGFKYLRSIAHKDVELSEPDLLYIIEIPGRAQHREQCVSVSFKFGALVTVLGVLHSKFMKAELLRDGTQFSRFWAVQADPRHAAPVPHHFIRFVQGSGIIRPAPFHVGALACARISHSVRTNLPFTSQAKGHRGLLRILACPPTLTSAGHPGEQLSPLSKVLFCPSVELSYAGGEARC